MILKGNFKRCQIQNCLIGDAHATQLAEAIRENPDSIQTFSLNKCPNLSTRGIAELLLAVGECTHLTKLELSKVFLDDTTRQELVALLLLQRRRRRRQGEKGEEEQDTSSCSSDGTDNHKYYYYHHWPKLKDLSLVETTDDMAEEPTCPETWQAFFRAALCHPTLRSLDLTLNDLDCDHMEALADELLAVRRLRVVIGSINSAADEEERQQEQQDDLLSNKQQQQQRKERASFPSSCGLDSLVLARNPIGDQGLKALCRGFSDQDVATTATSTSTSTSTTSIGNNNAMNSSLLLSLLSLGECSLTDLSPLLECHKTSNVLAGLERVYLYANQISDEAQTKQLQGWIEANFERNEAQRERLY
jgi:hypothetical protein